MTADPAVRPGERLVPGAACAASWPAGACACLGICDPRIVSADDPRTDSEIQHAHGFIWSTERGALVERDLAAEDAARPLQDALRAVELHARVQGHTIQAAREARTLGASLAQIREAIARGKSSG